MQKKLVIFGISGLVIIILVAIIGASWYVFINNEKNYGRSYGRFSELHNLSIQPTLIEENNNLYVQCETDKPISEDTWVNVGYDGAIFAGTKVYSQVASNVYYNREVNGKYQHRVLAAWAIPEQRDIIQFQILDEDEALASDLFTLNYKEQVIK